MKKRNEQTPVQKNEMIEVTFEDFTHDGAGVAKINGYPLFVPYGIPGETGKVKVVKMKKNYGYGRFMEIKKESTERIEPLCPIYKQCGGCQLQHMTYEKELQFKHQLVTDAMKKIGGLESVPVHPVIGMEDPWYYRNKAQVPVGTKEDGRLKAGFYQQRTHHIIDMKSCFIQEKAIDRAVQTVKNIADKYHIPAYDEKNHRGVLRHIVVRYGKKKNELMIIFITKETELPHKKKLIEDIRTQIPNVTSIVQNINPKRTNVIFGDTTRVLWGEEYIHDTIGDITFAISARSFYQVNPIQTKVLYEKALEYAALTGTETVIDAYCGIGTISLFLAQKAKHVYGVEIVPEAIADAKRNAKLNDLEDVVDFAVGEAEKVIPWWHQALGIQPDVIVVDPPRKGCAETLLETMIDIAPKRIVYVSCNPSTLARDLKILSEGGYEVKEIQPVDMFPRTKHVECVSQIVLK